MIRTRRLWEERFHPADKGWGVLDIALDNTKKQLLIAAFEKGFQRFELDGNGSAVTAKHIIRERNGHRGLITKVSWHSSGKHFATCGTDHVTIVWKDDYTPERPIKFGEIPHVLAWNPKILQLITAAGSELVSYTPPREPSFYRMQSTIWCTAWNALGEIYAVGLENGAISLRDRHDNELHAIHRESNYPIWSVCWAPPESPRANLLTVADWGRKISFYDGAGKQVEGDYEVDFVPLSLCYSGDGQIIIACGADRKVHVLSTACTYVGRLFELRSWPLRCIQRRDYPNRAEFLVICADGVLSMMETSYERCSHYHMGHYVCRESLVNVSVRALEKGREAVIAIQNPVLKVGVYRNLVAVATSSRVTIYRQLAQEMMLRYEELWSFTQSLDCQQLLIGAISLLLIQQNTLQARSFSGVLQQIWTLPGEIKSAKVTGGAAGGEVVFLALHDGTLARIVLNQPFVDVLLKIPSSIVSFDINLNLTKVALVGENGILYVYNLETREQSFQEPGADSCAWNQYHPDILAFSHGLLLKIKLGDQKVHARRTETPVTGLIIGYSGSKVFYDTENRVIVVDVPHTMLIHQSVEIKNFQDAYEIASFGASDNDWKTLGNRALDSLNFGIAKACFRRVRDYPTLALIDELEQRSKIGDGNADLYLGDVLAYRGRFEDAARSYSAGGRPDLSVKLFTDLRKFAQAEEWASDEEQRTVLLELRADWAVKADDKREAVELFLQLGDTVKAIEAMKEIGWGRRILDTLLKLDSVTDKDTIAMGAKVLLDMNDPDSAAELYERIKDIPTVVSIKLATKDWDYLQGLAEREPFHREAILLPYAEYLVENDRFTEARTAFARAGRPEESSKILSQLAKVAVDIQRFSDASFYNWLLGRAAEESFRQHPDKAEIFLEEMDKFSGLADVYSAYAVVDAAIQDPFSALSTETVFSAARILASVLWNVKQVPEGVRSANVLYVLAVWAMKSDAFKTARIALERLKELRLPKSLQGRFTEILVQNRTKPFQDPQDLSDFCHTCSSFNSLLNTRNGNACLSCGSSHLYCPVSFEHLPLVEFHVPPDVSQSEAVALLAMERSSAPASEATGDRMQFNQTAVAGGVNNDQFFASFHRTGRIVVTRQTLRDLREEEVVVLRHAAPLRWRFFRNMLADVVRVTACSSCWKMFNHDDFFAGVLELGCCPFCREPVAVKSDET